MSVKCPGCGAFIADLPIRVWEMTIGRNKSAQVRIKAYGCPKCLRKFRTGERVSGAPKT